MIPFLYRSYFWRWTAGILAGLLAWLLVEVMLNIRYRYFELFSNPLNYLYAAIYGLVILEMLTRLNLFIARKVPWDKGPARTWLVQTLAGSLVVLLAVVVVRLLFNLFILPGKLVIFSDESIIAGIALLFLLTFNLAELGFFLNDRYRSSLAEMERYRKENAEYQFEMLKLQLNPHFLFNSLNTLSSLVYENPEKAGEFIRKLSDVYRYVLDNRSRELVSLAEEMAFIRSFTYLLGLRFQGMIEFIFKVDDDALRKKIAPMTLQLLVENAVKHNVVARKQPLSITIHSHDDRIMVSNNLQVKPEQGGTGVGLKNIASRYGFLTDRKVEISDEHGTFSVTIPLI